MPAEWVNWIADAATTLSNAKSFKDVWGLAQIALNLNGAQPLGHILAGVVLRSDSDFEQAELAFRRALALDPQNSIAMANLGAVIYDKNPAEALELLRAAMDKDPSSDFIAQTYMLAVMSSGDWERGWNLYNRRTRFPAVGNQICRYPDRIDGHAGRWDGITGKVNKRSAQVLLVGEEGIGERIMFASMVEDVMKTGATPLIEVTSGFERFSPWFRRSFPKLKICQGGESHAIDYHINIGDLGAMFRRKESDFPKHKGYMTWDKKRAAHFRHRLSPGPVIGLSYKSLANAGPYKSIPLKDLWPILRIPGATFVDLQYQGTEQERNAHAPLLNHLPDLDLVNDMDGVAALIGACDLVITVSSVAAHMAGAMGKKCWTFIPSRAGRMWFWGTRGEKSPWYPSMKLYRQELSADWKPSIERMAADLETFVRDYRS